MISKPAADSIVENTYLVLPEHTNAMGNIFGGTVMAWIDMIAAIVAYRHCRSAVVTVSMDELHFLNPVKLGDLVSLKASVNFTGKTSLEIGVQVTAEKPISGDRTHTSSAYLTFVALDSNGKPTPIPQIDPQTKDEKRRFEDGKRRREARLARVKK